METEAHRDGGIHLFHHAVVQPAHLLVEEKTAARQKELEQTFTNQINQYKQQGGQTTPSGGSASYERPVGPGPLGGSSCTDPCSPTKERI